jgi:hypothetical protein
VISYSQSMTLPLTTIINQSLHGVASYGIREDDAPHEGAFK